MGLTIHYSLSCRRDDDDYVKKTVHQMRQLALDLPFEEVGDIVDLQGEQCHYEARRVELQNGNEKNESLFWLLIQAGEGVRCPWNKHISRMVHPARIIGFDTWPGPGSEAANFGLCLYPAEIEWDYQPEDDGRFQSGHHFDWVKWQRFCRRSRALTRSPAAYMEQRKVPTKLPGWRWHSFCKTQYASSPQCGGIPNFLRCHISVITLLDRIAKLPGLTAKIEDEGKYGPATYSDDYVEASKTGRKPTYRRHKGLYNPTALAREVGQWNEFIAGFGGALSKALTEFGLYSKMPIKDFSNFEQLEFRGRNQKHLAPFLAAMETLAKATIATEFDRP